MCGLAVCERSHPRWTCNGFDPSRGHIPEAARDGSFGAQIDPSVLLRNCRRFLPDRYVEGKCPHCAYERARGDQCDSCGKDLNASELIDARCQLCGATPELKQTEHYFLQLSHF